MVRIAVWLAGFLVALLAIAAAISALRWAEAQLADPLAADALATADAPLPDAPAPDAPVPGAPVLGAQTSTDPPLAVAPPSTIDELRARISGVLLRAQVPGAGLALIDRSGAVWTGGVGIADVATQRPVTADTLFRVASITKSFVALALMILSERGRVDLNAPVSLLAPELAISNRWAAEQPITVAHLLEHTAGFDDMHFNERRGPIAIEALPLAQVLAKNPASRVARWRPGSRFSYANPGYTVAGYVIEKVTGRPYESVIERELLAPLGMTGAALRWTPAVGARLAQGYGSDGEAVPYEAWYHRPAANLMASARDLAALVQLSLGRGQYRGRTIVSPAGMARIEHGETAELDLGDASYGLGNGAYVSERALARGHDGGLPGFHSSYGYLSAQGVGFVVLLNATRSPTALNDIRHLLVEYLLRGRVVPPRPRADVPEDELARWVGAYHPAAPRHQVFAFVERLQPGLEVSLDAGHLMVQTLPPRGPPVELVPLGGDRFRVSTASAGHIQFGRDREGRRVFAAGPYFVEEPRAQILAFAWAPLILIPIFGSGWILVLRRLRRRFPGPGPGWPLLVTAPLYAAPHLIDAAWTRGVLGECNLFTVGICAATLVFALGSAGALVESLVWLARPGRLLGKLYCLVYALAACCTTSYLAAYGVIGIRLWRY